MANSRWGWARQWAARAWQAWSFLVQSVVGSWEWHAPPWAPRLRSTAAAGAQSALAFARRRPRLVVSCLLAALVLIAGGEAAWRWYRLLPKPEYAQFTVTPPERMHLEQPGAKPFPLVVRFDRSVAPLALAGKAVPSGLAMAPAVPGNWRWLDDRVLEFDPKEDWPIGQSFSVSIDKTAVARQVLLKTYTFNFASARFGARLVSAQFYQDPVNPGVKFGVFDIEFTHPVNTDELEHRIEVRLAGQKPGVLGLGRETTRFTVVYDKLKLNASIHSASLPIPQDPTTLELKVDAGIHAARGSNPTEPIVSAAAVPGLYSLSVEGVAPVVVSNERNEPEQVLLLNLSAATGEREVASGVKAWLLPAVRPAERGIPAMGSADHPYGWYAAQEVTEEVLKHADAVPLEQIPAEREYVETHSFRYHADVGRYVFVQVDKDLKSFGGYVSPHTERFIVEVPPFPPELKILSQGALLALSGERKIAALVRDLPGVRIDIARVLPQQLQHLVSQSEGQFADPSFTGRFGPDNFTERFERKIPLGSIPHGQAHYETIDLGEYLKSDTGEKRGIFLLTVQSYDPRAEQRRPPAGDGVAAVGAGARTEQKAAQTAPGASAADAAQTAPGASVADAPAADASAADGAGVGDVTDGIFEPGAAAPGAAALRDQRLVLVTDLGILLKRSTDGSQDVFVQSIATGLPVAGAAVEIVAKNGTLLTTQTTDAEGHARFLKLDALSRERAPLLVQVTKNGDLSFLPLDHPDRSLDYSRFDIGGERSARSAGELTAYLFSDRGIYRPGDTIHIGMITKTADWSKSLAGIPLEAEMQDARGLTVVRERFKLPESGFTELAQATTDTAPTGTYTVNLFIVKDDRPQNLIGTTTVQVQEFEPDRMKVSARLSAESLEGWVSPQDLKASVNVLNLFGTPAEKRRVEATLTLTPAFPAFRNLPDYRFYDPMRAREGYSDKLGDANTDAGGNVTFDLGLQKYAKATYRVHFLARAFEPGGGRAVSADAAVLVSELPFLVGFKSDGDLSYVSRASERTVSWVAIDPQAKRTAAAGLTLKRVETKFVSVLTKQNNGTYQYQSRRKDITLSEEPFSIAADGLAQTLITDTPGTFAYVVRDPSGLELNRVEYTVVGQANLSRSLERNAELEIELDKKDYAPGEDIELSIKAPYTGAGLITIERDHVYAAQWFKSATTASVQKIRVPRDFEGNGYVNVQFIRDPGSDEIFTSPLSYGVMPFATNLAARTERLTLTAPALVKPGDTLNIELASAGKAQAVVFAIDEGILQVARYQAPDPLSQFFRKRALEVKTAQILDLILPEFERVMAAAAPGGDGEAALRRNLNPFKRKHDKPAVYWSGIVDLEGAREFHWTVPDSFNGSLKLFAVAVNAGAIGVAQAQTAVRGDFVLTPNMPVAVAPGDEFDVSVGIANNVAGSGPEALVQVRAELPPELEAVSPLNDTQTIGERREGVLVFRFRARAVLGAAPVRFTASWREHAAHLVSDVSVRPASPYDTQVYAGYFGSSVEVPIHRSLYPNYRKLDAGVSTLPLVLTGGLAEYLDDYPHLCTEQLVSRGFPALVIARRPELARTGDSKLRDPREATAALVAVLRSRQNAEGGFGLWDATVETNEFASVYALHWMIDAREQGQTIPPDLFQKGEVWLKKFAASPVADQEPTGIAALRNRAYAAYLLTRLGIVTTPIVASLRETLDARYPAEWRTDLAAAYLASVYELQHQDREASALIDRPIAVLGSSSVPQFNFYYDDTVRDARVLYLLSRHFPDRARALKPQVLQALVTPFGRGDYNTLSAAALVTAFDAYASNVPSDGLAKFTGSWNGTGGKGAALDLKGQLILRAPYDGDAEKLHFTNDTGLSAFYVITNGGFDRNPPMAELHQGIEILREYLDAGGRPVTSVENGAEITVRLRVRSLEAPYIGNVAITDLLPGGFEPVLARKAVPDPEGEPQADEADQALDPLGGSGGWRPEFADVREDRVVLYGALSRDIAEYTYRIRATNAGSFLVPPSYVESMYDRSLRAHAASSRVTVVQPAAH